MARIEPDSIHPRTADLADGETLRATFRADMAAYWKSHLMMAVVLGAVAGVVLMAMGNPYPVAGPMGAVLAIGARASFLQSDAKSDVWSLTDRRLLGPGGQSIPLAQIAEARPFLGAVQIITRSGDKHLIKYLADPKAIASQILAARGRT